MAYSCKAVRILIIIVLVKDRQSILPLYNGKSAIENRQSLRSARQMENPNEAKRLLKTKGIVLLQIAIAKRYMKAKQLSFVKPRGC